MRSGLLRISRNVPWLGDPEFGRRISAFAAFAMLRARSRGSGRWSGSLPRPQRWAIVGRRSILKFSRDTHDQRTRSLAASAKALAPRGQSRRAARMGKPDHRFRARPLARLLQQALVSR